MSESTYDDSNLVIVQNPKNNSLFSSSIKKIIIIAKKNKKYFFPKIPHFTKDEKIKEGLILFLAIISYFLYYLSLGGCDGTQTECLKNSNIAYYYMLVNYCFISAGLTAFIIFLMVYKRITKLHLIHQVIIFLILFLSDTGSTLMHHGIYNIFGFILFLIFYSVFLIVIVKIEDILLQKSLPIKLVVINIIILIIIFWRYAFHEALKRECKNWDIGLNGTRIEDDINKYPCQIFRPISCHINYFSKKQDLSRLLKLDCSNNINSNQAINSRNQLIKYINKKEFENTTRFGFPLTNRPKFIITPDLTPNTFTQKVYDNIIDMDNKSIIIPPDEYPEITLTFKHEDQDNKKGDNSMKFTGKININLTKNEALSASRKKMETPDTLFNNIIMIYTDAVSRAHFKRNMPKTCAFIEKLMKNNFDNDFNEYKKKVIELRKTNINNINLTQNCLNKSAQSNTLSKTIINNNTNIIYQNSTLNFTMIATNNSNISNIKENQNQIDYNKTVNTSMITTNNTNISSIKENLNQINYTITVNITTNNTNISNIKENPNQINYTITVNITTNNTINNTNISNIKENPNKINYNITVNLTNITTNNANISNIKEKLNQINYNITVNVTTNNSNISNIKENTNQININKTVNVTMITTNNTNISKIKENPNLININKTVNFTNNTVNNTNISNIKENPNQIIYNITINATNITTNITNISNIKENPHIIKRLSILKEKTINNNLTTEKLDSNLTKINLIKNQTLNKSIPIKGRETFLNQSNNNITNKNNSINTNKITQILKNNNIDKQINQIPTNDSLKQKLRMEIINKTNISFNNNIFKTKINNTGINIINKKPIRKLETINITNYFENKYYAYQFLKYHTFNSGTKFNAMPMFYGTTVFNPIGTNIIKFFKQLGYITAQSTDMCSKEVWEPEKEPQYLDFDSWDHENVAMFCDPSYMDRKSLYSIYKGVYSLLRRCFYGKEIHDYIFEYGIKFWEAYPDNKKFLRLGFNDGHESTFEVLKYLDEPLEQFLQYFLEKGYLKNTALFIVSDHGNHMPGIYNLFFSQQFETERVLANFYLIINSANLFGDKLNMFRLFNLNTLENQQSLITPYDIHDTLMHMIYGNHINKFFSKKGKSVFWKIDNAGRTCDFFDQDDEEKGLCRCIPNSKYEKFVYYDNNKR